MFKLAGCKEAFFSPIDRDVGITNNFQKLLFSKINFFCVMWWWVNCFKNKHFLSSYLLVLVEGVKKKLSVENDRSSFCVRQKIHSCVNNLCFWHLNGCSVFILIVEFKSLHDFNPYWCDEFNPIETLWLILVCVFCGEKRKEMWNFQRTHSLDHLNTFNHFHPCINFIF